MTGQPGTERLLLTLEQDGGHYALPAIDVREILPLPGVTALPRQPEWLLGICNYQGTLTPVVSFGRLCGGKTAAAVCVICALENGRLLGLAVERAAEIRRETGETMAWDAGRMHRGLLRLDRVEPGDPPLFVLDLAATAKALGDSFTAEADG